ncbi:sigma 54-interacting transcriptional regulator [Bremerella sp. JC770]|uniref:sigma 54-interacting transcriptional regulator n=1 Tax=Bremerella sp. JC770 TaxID=3232137 RepID=UPI0034585AD3
MSTSETPDSDNDLHAWHQLSQLADRDEFRSICESSTVGICVLHDDRIIYHNPSLAELLLQPHDRLLGARFTTHIPGDHDWNQDGLAKWLASDDDERHERQLRRSDGSLVDVELRVSEIRFSGRPSTLVLLVDISARKQAERLSEERLAFEHLLTDLSASFVNLPVDQIGTQIDASLKMLVDFLGNDRSTLVEFCDDASHVEVTHSYAVPSCPTFVIGPFSISHLPWFIGQFQQGKCVFIRDTQVDLPLEATKERQHCQKNGIKSNVTVPLKAGGKVIGGLTFAFIEHRCDWSAEVLSRLQVIGEVFTNALLRRRSEKMLSEAADENRRLREQLEQENLYLRSQAVLTHTHGGIVGRSDQVVRVLSDVEKVAAVDVPVLLLGETGTGKELFAHTIHDLSHRKTRTMVTVNSASLPATLVESELFGRVAGAYTGAASAQIGRFQLADGATLFLDEVGELPLELQAKLLRVLEDGRFEALGSPKTISVDVRIIAATNRDLEQEVREGRFRADLYHRLNVFPIQIPPLRERQDDIPPLVWHFVEMLGQRMGKSIKCVPRKTMQQLQQYPWPGNIRELRNVIERAMILANGDTLQVDVPKLQDQVDDLPTALHEVERQHILHILQTTGWRIRGDGGAAQLLDIKPTTLEARMAKLGIRRPNT